jgi:hypothetical protein
MKKKIIIYILILLVVAVVPYQVGWWRHVGDNALVSAIDHGDTDLGALWAIRRGNNADALKILESDLRASAVTRSVEKGR